MFPVRSTAEGNLLRNTGVIQFEEDENFWENHFNRFLSTAQPTRRPSLSPPTPRPPTTLPPFPTRFPTPSNGPPPTTLPPVPTPPTPPPDRQPSTRPPSVLVCEGISQLERAQQLTDIALGASGSIPRGSPQDLALQWLIETDPFFVCPQNPKAIQRYILAVFYFSTDGDNWDECSAPDDPNDADSIDEANDNCNVRTTPFPGGEQNPSFLPTTEGTMAWLTPVYECEWAGITCRVATNCVDRIEFGELNKIRSNYQHKTWERKLSLCSLSSLILLFCYLEDNGVGGVLPFEVRDLPDLRYFILERGTTRGTIPEEFAQIEDLQFLDLDFNELTGTIPESIYTLTDLFQLDLNDNLLTGTLR